MEKRKYPRIANTSLIADVSDGKRFFSGYVSNLSRCGLLLENIPEQIDHKACRISVIISGKGKNFTMITRPCWSKQRDGSTTLGLEILNAPSNWTEFIRENEPVNEAPLSGASF